MLAPRAMTFERCSGQIGHEHRIDSDSSIHVRALEQPLPYSILVNAFNFSDVFLLCVVRRTVQRIRYRSSATDTASCIKAVQRIRYPASEHVPPPHARARARAASRFSHAPAPALARAPAVRCQMFFTVSVPYTRFLSLAREPKDIRTYLRARVSTVHTREMALRIC